jgi:signal transduction histidine kinase
MMAAGSTSQTARRFWTTRVALAVGFGVSLILLMLSGVYAIRGISQLEFSNDRILDEFLGRETRLDSLRSAIYISGTYVRDYLLEPDAGKAEQSRRALSDTRLQIQSLIQQARSVAAEPGEAMYSNLRSEIEEYWRALDPILNWTARQRQKEGYRFLHDEVLPRRSGMLGIADTIASVNQQQLMERDHQLVGMFSGRRRRLTLVLLILFLCGMALACATAFYILGLEEQTLAHLREVSRARQELRNLSARLVETQENERKKISRELHDAVGQGMSAVQFELHDLGVALSPYPEALRTRVDRIRELVESSVAMVRHMALLLRPSMLDDLGLAAALKWQAGQISKSTGVRIEIVDALPHELPEEHKLCIFRVVQEALNNVCRHARASSVEIALLAEHEKISVLIRDDGRGFRLPTTGGLGLIGMQERVESLGGALTVSSEPGKGASIEACLPLPQLSPRSNGYSAAQLTSDGTGPTTGPDQLYSAPCERPLATGRANSPTAPPGA